MITVEDPQESEGEESDARKRPSASTVGRHQQFHHEMKIRRMPFSSPRKNSAQPDSALQKNPFFACLPPKVWDSGEKRTRDFILRFKQAPIHGKQDSATYHFEFTSRDVLLDRMASTWYNRAHFVDRAKIRHWAGADMTDEQMADDDRFPRAQDEKGFDNREFRYLVLPCTDSEAATVKAMEDHREEAQKERQRIKKGLAPTLPRGLAAREEAAKILVRSYERVRSDIKLLVGELCLVLEGQGYEASGGIWRCRSDGCRKKFPNASTTIGERMNHLWWGHNYLIQSTLPAQ